MRRWGSWIVLAAAILLVACAAPRVLTEVELQEKALTDLNATMYALNKELDAVRSQQLLLPKGSPRYLSVGREVALLNEQSINLQQELEFKVDVLAKARRKAAEAATNAPVVSPPPAPASGTITTPPAPGEVTPPSPQNIEKPVSAERVQELFNELASDTFKGLNGEEDKYFGEIAKSGDIGLPVIKHFLDQDLDKGFGKEGPAQPPTLRQGILNVLKMIGSPAAEKILITVLSVTASAEEVFIIEAGLEKISPGKHGDKICAACTEILSDPKYILSPKQRGLLEAILAKYKAPRPKRN